jgi:hypothetical protein
LSVALRLYCSRLDEVKAKYDNNIDALSTAIPGAAVFDDVAHYLAEKHRLGSAKEVARKEMVGLLQTANTVR